MIRLGYPENYKLTSFEKDNLSSIKECSARHVAWLSTLARATIRRAKNVICFIEEKCRLRAHVILKLASLSLFLQSEVQSSWRDKFRPDLTFWRHRLARCVSTPVSSACVPIDDAEKEMFATVRIHERWRKAELRMCRHHEGRTPNVSRMQFQIRASLVGETAQTYWPLNKARFRHLKNLGIRQFFCLASTLWRPTSS